MKGLNNELTLARRPAPHNRIASMRKYVDKALILGNFLVFLITPRAFWPTLIHSKSAHKAIYPKEPEAKAAGAA